MDVLKYALLIDAENTSPKYISTIMKELKEYGVITYGRIYGDFTNPTLTEWNKIALEYALVTIQQPRYSSGKNSSDIMLVIDAMDILYQHNVDGFCIVTSDSDFTRLVNRIREEGMNIIGMGKSKASKTFIAACNEYKFLDTLSAPETEMVNDHENDTVTDDENTEDEEIHSITSISQVKDAISETILHYENNGARCGLGGLKSQLQRQFPDFDERNYGYNSFMRFIKQETNFKIVTEGTTTFVVSDKQNSDVDVVKEFVKNKVKNGMDLGVVGQELYKNFPDFKIKDHGYSQLSRFISSIKGIKIVKQGTSNIVKPDK